MLHKLVFDASDANTIAASANTGAYLRSGKAGALLSHHSSVENPGISFVFVDADINAGNDTISESNHGLDNGDVVQFTTSGTLPSALSLSTNYYIIRVSSSLFKVASSEANAEAGIAIDLAADGSGNHTLTSQSVDLRARDLHNVNPITVDVSLDHTTDSIKIGDGTDFLAINNDGSINATVSATNLDIRDLVFATDKVDVSGSSVSISGTVAVTQSTSPWVIGDGGSSITVDGTVELGATTLAALETITVDQGTSPWVIGDGGSSITVDASDLDIRDLSHTQDSIKIGDGTDFLAINNDGSINVVGNDVALANAAMLANAETVGTSAAQIIDGGDELASRKYVMLYNNSNKAMYIGPSGVTVSTGFPLFPGSMLEARIGAAVDVYAIGDGAGLNMRALQLS